MANWIDLATDSYEAAGVLVVAEHWRPAVSRAYFAAYARVAAALASQGVTPPQGRQGPSHAALPRLIEKNLVALSPSMRVPVSGRMKKLYNLRLLADYQPTANVDLPEAHMALGLMAAVFRSLKEAG